MSITQVDFESMKEKMHLSNLKKSRRGCERIAFDVLLNLHTNNRKTRIASSCDLQYSTLKLLLDKLVEKGFVLIRSSITDSQETVILTDKGKEVVEEGKKFFGLLGDI